MAQSLAGGPRRAKTTKSFGFVLVSLCCGRREDPEVEIPPPPPLPLCLGRWFLQTAGKKLPPCSQPTSRLATCSLYRAGHSGTFHDKQSPGLFGDVGFV